MLPMLRQDLSLHDGPPGESGAPSWVLHDPAANRFYSLSWPAFEILSRWSLGDSVAVLTSVNQQTTLEVDEEDLGNLIEFLMQHNLLDAETPADSERLTRMARAGHPSIPEWLLKNYLFLRVPLFRPARWLDRWSAWVAWAYSPRFWVGVAAMAFVGLCLASRQWGSFVATFSQYKSFSGIAAIAVALSLAKVLHELGHAFTAQRYGCRVSTMGVAFLVMLPVLYTDTNEAWKLADKGKRLRIAAAGVLAELALAAVATVVWSFLPDGPVRAGVFLLASTTWILTLAVNASPFMRFDGYFLLCDWLDMPNLHTRAFSMGRWWLREMLFDWSDPPPEQFKPERHAFLIVFALTTWIYRLVLFLGIAYLVYDAFFKLLGIALLFVELGWFIVLPMYHEVEVWWDRRRNMSWNAATIRSALALATLTVLMFLPLQREVRAPGVLGAAQSQALYAVAAARVLAVAIAPGADVIAGQVLVRLDSPDLTHRLALAESQVRSLRAQLDRQPFDDKLLEEGEALRQRWAAANAEVTGLKSEIEQLVVRAPFSGHAMDVNENLTEGAWVALHEKLMHITGIEDAKGEILVSEADMSRLSHGAAIFVAERGARPHVACRMGAVDRINLTALDSPYLASTYGGAVRVQADPAGVLVPTEALFRARLTDCRTGASPRQEVRGTAHIPGDPASLAGVLLRQGIRSIQAEMGR
jgi:putative peptide zinc metalloprotease protein